MSGWATRCGLYSIVKERWRSLKHPDRQSIAIGGPHGDPLLPRLECRHPARRPAMSLMRAPRLEGLTAIATGSRENAFCGAIAPALGLDPHRTSIRLAWPCTAR